MKNLILILSLFLLQINCFAQTKSNDFLKKMILENIFNVKEIVTANNYGNNIEILITGLRDNYASIPLDKCILIQMSDDLVAMTFEIYLSENQYDYKKLIDTLDCFEFPDQFAYFEKVDINKNKVKLIQLIYFDLKNKKFIGKPEGFPLEQNFWIPEGYGDSSQDLFVESFKSIADSEYGCQLVYNDGYWENDFLIILRLCNYSNYSEIVKSKTIRLISSSLECIVEIKYNNIREQKLSIIADKYTKCDCNEDCLSIYGIKVGEHNETIELLKW